MPRYLIHIGPHKTGTTYLQASFQALRQSLLERGICYPQMWQGEYPLGHQRLAPRLQSGTDDGLADAFRRLEDQGCHTILISAEDLSDLTDYGVAYFRSLLGNAAARIIFYCRRWSETMPSAWQETVKQGHTMTLPEFTAENIGAPLESKLMNYDLILRRYSEQFGADNISLVSYSNIIDDDGDLFVHFCRSFLSWIDPPVPDLGKLNVSLDIVDVEVIRALNVIEQSAGGARSSAIRQSYMRHKNELDLSKLASAIESDIHHLRINEGFGPLQHLHERLFQQFGSLLVEPRSGPRLFTPRSAGVPYARQNYLASDECAAALQDIYRRIHGAAPHSEAAPARAVAISGSRHPLLQVAELLYRDEATLATRTAALERFLREAPMDHDYARRLLEEKGETDRYARFHSLRHLDQLRAFSALATQHLRPIELLDIGVAPITPMYQRFADVALTTADLPGQIPAAHVTAEFGAVSHHDINLEMEALSKKHPDLIGKFDIVMFCDVIAHVRAGPTEQIADLLATLKPGGHMVVTTPNALSCAWIARLMTGRLLNTVYKREKLRNGTARDFHVREYTPTELREAITEAGANVIHEGLFNWYGEPVGTDLPRQISGRAGMMFIAQKPAREGQTPASM